jgi:hypothetical protein
MEKKKSNLAKGRDSYDATVDNSLVAFFNRNVTPYPTEVGGPKLDLVPVTQRKDIMLNAARMHAEQEYNRITDLMTVLAKQAAELKRRLDITDMVHAAEYQFQPAHGQTFWLLYDSAIENTRLIMQGPTDWTTGKPDKYEYICQVQWLGDYTWTEVTTQS